MTRKQQYGDKAIRTNRYSGRNACPNKSFRLRPLTRCVLGALLTSYGGYSLAGPTGGTTVAGNVTITNTSPTSVNVLQQSDKAIVNWQTFNVLRNESVNFAQPSSSSVILNRVIGGGESQIFGRITANGNVFLTNPAGILFGRTASVDVQGLVATTLGISNSDFMAGRYLFSNDGAAGSVTNQGQINARSVVFAGPQVSNEGLIVARLGSVGLGAGDRVTLDLKGDGLLSMSVDAAALKASVSNSGTIIAEGGNVLLSARAKDALLDTVINLDGIVRANTLVEQGGRIILDGGPSGVVNVSGTLDASGTAAGQTGPVLRT
jgi:trimeric autotransporter adhesin